MRLRYFVPRHEMEMCVHATVAAVVLLGRGGALPEAATIETPLGKRTARWDAAAGPVQSVSTAHPKLMIPLADEHALDASALDAEAAWALCDRLDVTGL